MWETILWPLGAALVRVIPGWLENALEDGKVESFELAKLGATLFRVGTLSFFTSLGLDIEMSTSAAIAGGTDFLMTWLDSIFRKNRNA